MPSGFKIDWSMYDDVIRAELPQVTVTEFVSKFLPDISTKAVSARARKLGVEHARYLPTIAHKSKISQFNIKNDESLIAQIRELRDHMSINKMCKHLSISKSLLNRLIVRHHIALTESGKARVVADCTTCSLGKVPWNKGKKLPEDMKIKMAIGRQRQSGRTSKLQLSFYDILDACNVTYFKDDTDECRYGPYVFDARIKHNNVDVLVEVQGDYWHSLPKTVAKDAAKATYMERYWPGMPVKYVWEHEFCAGDRVRRLVRQWIGEESIEQIDFDFSNVVVEQIDRQEASKFLTTYHYLGKLDGICLGAKIDDKIIAVATWVSPQKTRIADDLNMSQFECLELRRFAIHDAYHKPGFASWLLACCSKSLPTRTKVLIGFADPAADHDDSTYVAAGWSDYGLTDSSYFYVDNQGYVILKKTVHRHAQCMHMNESDFAIMHGYTKTLTLPKRRFVKWL